MFEFFPMVFFLVALFGYMDILIIGKWITVDASQSHCAPSILLAMINIFLWNHGDCPVGFFYPYQKLVEIVVLIIVFLCVILLLVPKPVILIWRNKKFVEKLRHAEARNARAVVDKLIADNKPTRQNVHANEEFRVQDVVIHQTIKTIEYCLGCISHTASYLRLWALSLAHAELTDVLWHFFLQLPMLMPGIGKLRWVLVFCGWSIWAALTVAILLLMEGLSAFLHTLRLHWVEFQSKFYEGDGRGFEPFYFKTVLERAAAAD